MSSSEPLLDVRDLHVDIPLMTGVLHAVRGISFSVGRGETLCLVGESGCGKSLTALAVMGLLPRRARRRAAQLRFAGQDMLQLDTRGLEKLRGDRMAMIFQEPMTSLNPAFTIGDQLAEVLRQHRPVSRREARDRAVFLLEKVGITAAASRLGQYPHQLSGGLRQRVMIAMALMCGPELILADEPTTALDVTVQAQLLHLLVDLQREFGMAMIFVTHDLGVVSRIADKVAVMYAGKVVEAGGCQRIFRDPLHPYTRGLMRCIPVPGRTKPGEKLAAIPGIVPALVGEMTGCAFRYRCPMAHDACADDPVPVRGAAGEANHRYRCVLTPERLREEAVWEGAA